MSQQLGQDVHRRDGRRQSCGGRAEVRPSPALPDAGEREVEDFAALYGDAGLRVIRCSGDFTDETGLLLSGRYDIAFLTYEMFLSLGVSSPHICALWGWWCSTKASSSTDPGRGISVELLLTLLLASRSRGIAPQLIVLSAVIGAIKSFDEWLGTKPLIWTKRPVPLR